MTRRANELDDDGGDKTWLVETALSPLDVFILQNLLFARVSSDQKDTFGNK